MIQTKIARVISSTEVILAAGYDHGVREGTEFVIYELSESILDPETGEDLGRIEIVKGRVIAAHVQEKMTTARTKVRVIEETIDLLAGMRAASGIFQPRTIKTQVQDELKVEGAVGLKTNPIVRVGDYARTT